MFQPDATSEMMKGERCTLEFIRDYTMYAAILGFFSLSWFGWAQEKPRESWRKYLGMASGVSLLVCLIGVYLSVNNWNAPSALSDTSTFQTYLITVYIEFFLAGAGAIVLLLRTRGHFVYIGSTDRRDLDRFFIHIPHIKCGKQRDYRDRNRM